MNGNYKPAPPTTKRCLANQRNSIEISMACFCCCTRFVFFSFLAIGFWGLGFLFAWNANKLQFSFGTTDAFHFDFRFHFADALVRLPLSETRTSTVCLRGKQVNILLQIYFYIRIRTKYSIELQKFNVRSQGWNHSVDHFEKKKERQTYGCESDRILPLSTNELWCIQWSGSGKSGNRSYGAKMLARIYQCVLMDFEEHYLNWRRWVLFFVFFFVFAPVWQYAGPLLWTDCCSFHIFYRCFVVLVFHCSLFLPNARLRKVLFMIFVYSL